MFGLPSVFSEQEGAGEQGTSLPCTQPHHLALGFPPGCAWLPAGHPSPGCWSRPLPPAPGRPGSGRAPGIARVSPAAPPATHGQAATDAGPLRVHFSVPSPLRPARPLKEPLPSLRPTAGSPGRSGSLQARVGPPPASTHPCLSRPLCLRDTWESPRPPRCPPSGGLCSLRLGLPSRHHLQGRELASLPSPPALPGTAPGTGVSRPLTLTACLSHPVTGSRLWGGGGLGHNSVRPLCSEGTTLPPTENCPCTS